MPKPLVIVTRKRYRVQAANGNSYFVDMEMDPEFKNWTATISFQSWASTPADALEKLAAEATEFAAASRPDETKEDT